MRFMMAIKSDEATESGQMPPQEGIDAMIRYNEELVKAGVLLAAEGLHPSSKGAKVVFTDGRPTVTDGPFTEAKELIAGFWIIQVSSREEALEWAKRIPRPPQGRMEVELRQVHELEEFGPELSPEARASEERMRAYLAGGGGAEG
jgi:hypothetical protein